MSCMHVLTLYTLLCCDLLLHTVLLLPLLVSHSQNSSTQACPLVIMYHSLPMRICFPPPNFCMLL